MAFPGVVQILDLIRNGIVSVSDMIAKFVPYTPYKIQIFISVLIAIFTAYKTSKLLPENFKFVGFWIISGFIYYLLNYYGK